MSITAAESRPLILGFPDSQALTQDVAQATGLPHACVEVRRFPDGESYVRLPETLPAHVILVRSLADANNRLLELLFAAKTARANGVKRLSLIAPYLCYMRQDSLFRRGEAMSQRIVGELLAEHVDDLLSIDPHLHRTPVLSDAMPVKNTVTLTATGLIGEFLSRELPAAPIIIGPDAESEQWACQVAAAENLTYAVAKKVRYGDRDVRVELPALDVQDRIIVIIDDICSSGETLAQAAQQLTGRGAQHIHAAVTHALMDDAAMQVLADAGIAPVWSTNTNTHATNAIGVAPVISQAIEQHLR